MQIGPEAHSVSCITGTGSLSGEKPSSPKGRQRKFRRRGSPTKKNIALTTGESLRSRKKMLIGKLLKLETEATKTTQDEQRFLRWLESVEEDLKGDWCGELGT
jgi:hypothetical protein